MAAMHQGESRDKMKVPFKVELDSKTAVITGGGGVLAGAFAEALAACGAKVAILDLNGKAAEMVAQRILKQGGQAMAIETNVLERDNLEKANEKIVENFGSVEILINGAGGNHPKGTTSKEYLLHEDLQKNHSENEVSFFDLQPEGIQFVFNLNFLGSLLPTQVFSRSMAEKGNGVIVNVSSMNALTPLTKIPAYSAAKAAVSNFTQWLSVHMSQVGVRVNAIAPGFFLTEQNRSLLIKDDGSFNDRAEKILSQTPARRFGAPEELIGTLLWLVDNASSGFVNGTVIPVDGGFSAYSGV